MNRTTAPSLLCIAAILCCSSCVEKAFYQSPLMGSMQSYHALPLASDSTRSATYASVALDGGVMNYNLTDGVFSLQAAVHRSHVVDCFRFHYGAAAGVGGYHVKPYHYYNTGRLDTNAINRGAGTRFYGSFGVFGGLSAAAHMGRGEWRFLGLEGNLYNEFGDYYQFRKNLPDSAATTIDRHNYLGSLALTTEFLVKSRSAYVFGFKMAVGSYLRRLDYNVPNYETSHSDLIYFSATWHLRVQRATSYLQLNAANNTLRFQIGLNYRL